MGLVTRVVTKPYKSSRVPTEFSFDATAVIEPEVAFNHWLAGFIAAEGCFRVHRTHKNEPWAKHSCFFSLKLRDDDTFVLREILQRTGIGKLHSEKTRSGGSKPATAWNIESKIDCMRLVVLLDSFPLRARKAHDYAIWRDAVMHWTSMTRGNRWSGPSDWGAMAAFKTALEEVRQYKPLSNRSPVNRRDLTAHLNPEFGHWIAGFLDGDGCFTLTGAYPEYFSCASTLSLRDDDADILHEIARCTGIGRLCYSTDHRPESSSNPTAAWIVSNKDECLRLVNILDHFHLRAKKAQDYRVWREAVILLNTPDGYSHDNRLQLALLKSTLENGKVYRGPS